MDGWILASPRVGDLHIFAGHIGLGRGLFRDVPGRPHYVLPDRRRIRAAFKNGAVLVSLHELYRLCWLPGLNGGFAHA